LLTLILISPSDVGAVPTSSTNIDLNGLYKPFLLWYNILMDDNYQNTIETYTALGKPYLDSIDSVEVDLYEDFALLIPKGGTVLDVGCAGGRDTERFLVDGYRVTGIDFVPDFIKQAKARLPKADFMVMDMLDIKLPNEYFDGVFASAVLVHLKKNDISKALSEFYRVLNIKGHLYVYVKRGQGTTYLNDKLSTDKKRFFSFFEQDEINGLVAEAGFKILKSQIFDDHLGRDIQWIATIAEKA